MAENQAEPPTTSPYRPRWLKALLRLLESREPVSLRHFLILALLIRLPAVFFSRGYEFADHQFIFVDPAYHLATGGTWYETWDYDRAIRSWVYPCILSGVFKGLSLIGLEGPQTMMTATRGLHALISLLPMWAMWMLLVRWRPIENPNPILLLMAASGLTVYNGVQPNGTAFAVGLSLAAVFLFHAPGFWRPFFAGALLGGAFSCRFQDAFFGPVLFAGGALKGRWKEVLGLCIGSAVTVTIQGLVDLSTYGAFLCSPFNYVKVNFLEGVSAQWRTEPFWYYLAIVAAALLVCPPFLRVAWEATKTGARTFPLPLACAAFYFLMHTLVARKAFRFVFPALALVLFVFAVGMFCQAGRSRLARIHRRLIVATQLLGLLVLSFAYFHRGPIEAALWLRGQPDFQNHLVVVDGTQTDLGGHYYLGRRQLQVHTVARTELSGFLKAFEDSPALYLMSVREPLPETFLSENSLRQGWAVDLRSATRSWPNFKKSRRRYLYLARPTDGG